MCLFDRVERSRGSKSLNVRLELDWKGLKHVEDRWRSRHERLSGAKRPVKAESLRLRLGWFGPLGSFELVSSRVTTRGWTHVPIEVFNRSIDAVDIATGTMG